MSDTHIVQILYEGLLGPLLEIAAKGSRGKTYQAGYLFQFNRLVKVLHQILIYLIETFKVGRIDGLGETYTGEKFIFFRISHHFEQSDQIGNPYRPIRIESAADKVRNTVTGGSGEFYPPPGTFYQITDIHEFGQINHDPLKQLFTEIHTQAYGTQSGSFSEKLFVIPPFMGQLRSDDTDIAHFIIFDMITYKAGTASLLYTHDLYFGMIMPRNNEIRQIFPVKVDVVFHRKREFLIKWFHSDIELNYYVI